MTSDLPAVGSQPVFDRQLSWDDQGRIGSITDLANPALSATYGYDALDRLATGTQGASSWGYTYNGVDDRLTSSAGGSSTTYGLYPGTHRLQSLTGSQSKSYTYDAAGNLASDGTTTWTFGGNNRPTQAGTSTFLINALGQRVKKTTATSATRFVYDEAGRLAGEYADDGSLVEETVWLGDLPVATLRPNGTGVDIDYVHPDPLGTPRLVTRSSDNAVVWRWDNTEPFGSSAPDENPGGLGTFAYNLRFPGQYFDAETGTNYNMARDYDARIGRYLESDPVGLDGGLNTFGYVSGNPLAFIDPRGLFEGNPLDFMKPGLASCLRLSTALVSAAGAAVIGMTYSNPGDACSDDPGKKRKECRNDDDPCDQLLNKNEIKRLKDRAGSIEKFKEDHGARPAGHYDLYKCKDGTIVIKRKGDSRGPGERTLWNVNLL